MERETLKQAIRRYTTVLRCISDDRAMAVPTDALAETVGPPQEARPDRDGKMPKVRSKDRHNRRRYPPRGRLCPSRLDPPRLSNLSSPRLVSRQWAIARRAEDVTDRDPLGWASRMEDERRLVGRVLRHWTEMVHQGDFPRLDEIDPWMLGDDWANCLLIAMEEPVERSHFVSVGKNL